MTFQELLTSLNACTDAKEWASNKTWEEVYRDCSRGDWMLWLFQKTNPDNLKELTLAKGHCANTVRHLMKDNRSIKAVDTAIAFGEGKATIEELDSADAASIAAGGYAAAAAGSAAGYDAGYAAGYAAAGAAGAAAAAAYDSGYAGSAGYAAAAASSAAGSAAGYIAIKENQQLTADICRKYLPIEIWNIKN